MTQLPVGVRLAVVLWTLLPLAVACRTGTVTRTGSLATHDSSECAVMPFEATSGDGVFAVAGDDAEHHRLRFTDGQLSRNDSCMILMGNRLNRRIPPLYVNGEPVGFC